MPNIGKKRRNEVGVYVNLMFQDFKEMEDTKD